MTNDYIKELLENALEKAIKSNLSEKKLDTVDQKELDENEYKEFFQKALKRFGAESPADLSKEKKKEFFDYVDKNWEAKDEEVGEEELDEAYVTKHGSYVSVGDFGTIQAYVSMDGSNDIRSPQQRKIRVARKKLEDIRIDMPNDKLNKWHKDIDKYAENEAKVLHKIVARYEQEIIDAVEAANERVFKHAEKLSKS